jgi:hypothetical protein
MEKISLSILIAYVLISCINFGIPKSLSETYYLFEGKWKHSGTAFTILLWIIAFSVIPFMLNACEWQQFVAFISGASLVFVGTAPRFKSIDKSVHKVAAYISVGMSAIWGILMGLWYIPVIFYAVAFVIISFNRKGWKFWIEMAAFASIYTALEIIKMNGYDN